MTELTLDLPAEDRTSDVGRKIGEKLEPGDILALWGELGAGKTFLARSIARGLGVPPSIPITSPTFAFINEYEGRLHVYHIDLYRLTDPDELETLPWREALFGTGVALIEWPERLGQRLPEARWDIRLTVTGDESRLMNISAHGRENTERLEIWARELAAPGLDP